MFFVILFHYTDTETDEFLQIKVYNHDFRVSDSVVRAMLSKANLTGHGYKREVTTKLVQKAEVGKPDYQACTNPRLVMCTLLHSIVA